MHLHSMVKSPRLLLKSNFNNGATSLTTPEYSSVAGVTITNNGSFGSVVSNKLTMTAGIGHLFYNSWTALDYITNANPKRFTVKCKLLATNFSAAKLCWSLQDGTMFYIGLVLLASGKLRLERTSGGIVLTSNTTLVLNREYTVIIDVNYAGANTARLLIDGVVDVSVPAGGALMWNAAKLIYFGGSDNPFGFNTRAPSVAAFVDGTLDDFEIYTNHFGL